MQAAKPRRTKTSWADVKRNLAQLDRAELEEILRDLYAAGKDNQSFMHARVGLGNGLKPYKDIVSRWISPNVLRNQHYSVSKANKAISDYRRAVGDPEGTAELSLFYCEEAVQFANDYGADDAGYCYAIVTMFKQCLKFIQELEAQKQVRFLERLDCLREDIQFGYGVEEEMNELLKEYCFDE